MTASARVSSLPRAFLCAGSIRDGEGALVDPWSDAAEGGTDYHRLLALSPEGDAPSPLLDELSEDARIVYFTCAKAWREKISAWMPNAEAETYFECEPITGFTLTGHTDVRSLNGDETEIAILDWKGGRKDYSYKHQGLGYLACAFMSFPKLARGTVHFYWPRTDELETYVADRARIVNWSMELQSRVVNWDGVYHPGEHCNGCKRSTTCPARAQMERRGLALLGQTLSLATMDGPQIFDLHAQVKLLQKTMEQVEDAIKAEARARGSVEDGNGRVMHYVPAKGPRRVDVLKAWPALTERLSDEELASCVRVSISDAEALVGEKAKNAPGAKRGAIKAAKESLAEALAQAGAVSQEYIEKFTIERKK